MVEVALMLALPALPTLSAAQATPQTKDRPATAATPASATPARPAPPRQRIELSPSDRQAIDRSSSAASISTGKPVDELVPTAADLTAPLIEDRQTRIEQVRTSNGISEIIVTPALGTPSFVITNREGRQPLSQTDLSGGLSVPKFFRWEFGGATPPPVAVPPPPTR